MNALLIITLIIISLDVFSQANYKEGYVITLKNDTVQGWIDFRTDKVNQRQCRFKATKEGTETTYSPGEIAAYRFTDIGNFYVSHNVDVEGENKTVFLQYLLQGMMDLYYYKGETDYFFFEDENGEMSIVTKNDVIQRDNYFVEDNKYKGRLAYMFKDHASLVDASYKADFNQKSMIGIAKMYHDEVCTTDEGCVTFETKNPDDDGVDIRFSVYAGVQIFTYGFYDYETEKFFNSTSVAPSVGGQIDIFNPRWTKSFALQGDVSFSRFSKSDAGKKYHKKTTYKYSGYTFSGKLGIKYIYPKYRLKPVVEAGVSALFFIGEEADMGVGFSEPLQVTPYAMKTIHNGYYAGIGLDYGVRCEQAVFIRFTFENYPMGNAIEEGGSDKLRLLHIKLGYTF